MEMTNQTITTPIVNSRKNILLLVILGLLVVCGSILIGIEIGKRQVMSTKQKEVANKDSSVIVEATQSPTGVETVIRDGWSVYKNYGFVVSYPNSKYTLVESKYGDGMSLGLIGMEGIDTHGYTGISFKIYPNQDLEEVVKFDLENMEEAESVSYQRSTEEINGLVFTKTTYNSMIGDLVSSLYIESAEGVIKISTPGNIAKFKEILDTFNLDTPKSY